MRIACVTLAQWLKIVTLQSCEEVAAKLHAATKLLQSCTLQSCYKVATQLQMVKEELRGEKRDGNARPKPMGFLWGPTSLKLWGLEAVEEVRWGIVELDQVLQNSIML